MTATRTTCRAGWLRLQWTLLAGLRRGAAKMVPPFVRIYHDTLACSYGGAYFVKPAWNRGKKQTPY